MATLKSIERSATVAFSPTASLMAVGTMAGAIDPSFSSSASLEILQLDFANTGQDLPVVNSCPTTERFNRLSWANNAVGSEEYSLGIIAGGLSDGSINLWNAAKLVSGDGADATDSIIARPEKHSGAVNGLEFSPLAPNLLASGGADGDLYIWDLKVPTTPTHYPPLRPVRAGGGKAGEISYLSWNRKVQPILAATSYSGTSVVWDLRKQKPVLSFTDPNSQRRCSTLQWNPENATQLVVASDDDRSPSLQVWDLRNSVSPLKEFVGHSKGVLAMAWCPMDSSLLLTCAKDNLTLCWDTFSGEVLYELPASNNWNFDVQWSPRTPGVLSTSSFDGNISIYNIEACSRTPSNEMSFGRELKGMDSDLKRAPKWLKRPAGVTFGFGGKLVTFGTKKGGPGVPGVSLSEITLHSLVTEEELVKKSTEFETSIAGGEKPVLRGFCESKAEKAGSEEEKETWSFLKVMFDDDARRKLLTHLNFDVAPTESETQDSEERVESDEAEPAQSSIISEGTPEINVPQLSPLDTNTASLGAEEDFFDNIQTPKTPEYRVERLEELTLEPTTNDGDISTEPVFEGEGEGGETEEAVQRALVVGDFKTAVQHCLASNRIADALILAYVGSPTLWAATQDDYIKKTGRPYLKILSAVVNNDLRSLVEKRPLKAWKETLALLCTYARSEDWTVLSDALAARLDAANDTHSATLCYVCSGNIEKAAEIWSRSLETVSGGRNYVDALQTLMEKVVVLSLATGQKRLGASLAKVVQQYAELLVSQGLLATAQEYLSLMPDEEPSPDLSVLQDRIYGTGALEANRFKVPSVPWEREELEVAQAHVQRNLSGQAIYPPGPYPPVEDASFYQPQVQSPRNFQVETTAVEQHQRMYPPAENLQSTYPNGGYVRNEDYGYRPTPIATNRTMYYPNTTESWRNNDGQPFTPSVAPQPFTPSAAPQPFTPGVPYTPVVPTQTFKPVPPPQTFIPTESVGPPPRPSFMPASPKSHPASAPGQGAPAKIQSPQLTSTPAPVAPPAPAPTVQNVDISNVSAELKPVVATLTRLYNETSEAFGGSRAVPAKRREIDNNSKKLGALFLKLNTADISANASSKLIQLCQALDVGDYASALQIQVDLTTSDWDECSVWLTALKQMIKVRQALR
ncbi:unnamed protein product [Calypogeia fissa]